MNEAERRLREARNHYARVSLASGQGSASSGELHDARERLIYVVMTDLLPVLADLARLRAAVAAKGEDSREYWVRATK